MGMGKNSPRATVSLCAVLNEKINLENVTQSHARFFTATQIFERIIFGGEGQSAAIRRLFAIDIEAYANNLERWSHGVEVHSEDVPDNRQWLDIVTAQSWRSDEEEMLKDIIADCVSLMMTDANADISIIGFNLAVFFGEFNEDFKLHLEREAQHRLKKYLVVTPTESASNAQSQQQQQNQGYQQNQSYAPQQYSYRQQQQQYRQPPTQQLQQSFQQQSYQQQ